MKYRGLYLRSAPDETPGGLQGKPCLQTMNTRRKTILYGADELRLYRAALTMEKIITDEPFGVR